MLTVIVSTFAASSPLLHHNVSQKTPTKTPSIANRNQKMRKKLHSKLLTIRENDYQQVILREADILSTFSRQEPTEQPQKRMQECEYLRGWLYLSCAHFDNDSLLPSTRRSSANHATESNDSSMPNHSLRLDDVIFRLRRPANRKVVHRTI